jgi:hypothetical protein
MSGMPLPLLQINLLQQITAVSPKRHIRMGSALGSHRRDGRGLGPRSKAQAPVVSAQKYTRAKRRHKLLDSEAQVASLTKQLKEMHVRQAQLASQHVRH